jgi:glycosyltransferase involved in cell wall biosynthesis
MNNAHIVVAYAGVHHAFQLALAAHEIAELQAFYCALYDDPAKWGHRFADYIGHWLNDGRRADGLDHRRVVEFPWPLLMKVMRDRFYPRGRDSWFATNSAFDWWASRRLAADPCEIFVGTSSSDLFSLRACKEQGSILIHDCPGTHPAVASKLFRQAAQRANIKRRARRRPWPRVNAMRSRILREYDLADILLVQSEFQRKGFEAMGFPPSRLFLLPLWVDMEFWRRTQPNAGSGSKRDAPLKLLFVGSIDLRKGIPFLLDAVTQCGKAVHLTIVGLRTVETDRLIDRDMNNVSFLPHQPKSALPQIYQTHDVLVLPSIYDPFPRVALEAMAAGLPVILSDNCGTPVPDESWRVPAMDSQRLAQRIMQYADDRTLFAIHGDEASRFAAGFSANAYRRKVQALFRNILAGRARARIEAGAK